jgi:putative ABC transport system permease protein
MLAVLAVALGITVATAVGTVALDVGDKVSSELRSFGANISVSPAADGLPVTLGGVDYRPAGTGAFLSEGDLVKFKRIFWRNNIVAFAPLLYAPATVGGRDIVLIGSWFDHGVRVDSSEVFRTGLKQLHPTWRVEGRWPGDHEPNVCLVGRRLAVQLGVKAGQVLSIAVALPLSKRETEKSKIETQSENPISNSNFEIGGILETGGAEDSQVLAPLAAVQKMTRLEGKVRRVEVSALTKPEDAFARSDPSKLAAVDFDRWFCSPYVSSIAYQIQQAIPAAEARPVYAVSETEGKILDRVGVVMALLAAAALTTAGLAVASMMLATVFERRVEIGLFKSLGATNERVAAIFLLEAAAIGLLGGVVGYAAGCVLARRLALEVFGTPANIHWVILPAAVALALLVTLAGSAIPVGRGIKISPALVLRD